MSIVLGTIYLILFIVLLYRWSFFDIGLNKHWLSFAFGMKFVIGLGLIAIYTFIYTNQDLNDVYKYYNDSEPIYEELWQDPGTFSDIFFFSAENDETKKVYQETNNWYRPYSTLPSNDNRLVIRLNVLLRIITGGGNIILHALIICFLMMISAIWLFKVFNSYTKNSVLLFLTITLFPSLALWTGALMKESILIFALSGFLYSLHQFERKVFSWSLVLLLFFCFVLMLYIKIYILLLLIPGLLVYLFKTFFNWSEMITLPLLVIFLLSGSFLLDYNKKNTIASSIVSQRNSMTNVGKGGIYFKDKNSLYYVPDEKRDELRIRDSTVSFESPLVVFSRKHKDASDTSTILLSNTGQEYPIHLNQKRSGSYHDIPELSPTTLSLLKQVPSALLNSLFRPYPSGSTSILHWVAVLENLVLMLLLLSSFFYTSHQVSFKWSVLIFSFGFFLLILVGLTTPIDGAIVRYRMPAYYLISIWCCSQINWSRVPVFRKYLN